MEEIMEVKRALNGWAKILLNPGEARELLHLLDKAYRPQMVGFGDGSMDSFIPDLRIKLRDLLPSLSYDLSGTDTKDDADRVASYYGNWWSRLWNKELRERRKEVKRFMEGKQ
jgi:hypothetical protein